MNIKFTNTLPTVSVMLPEYHKLVYAAGKLTKTAVFLIVGKMLGESIEISKFVFPRQSQTYSNPTIIQSSVDKIISDAKLDGMYAIGVGVLDTLGTMPSVDTSLYSVNIETMLSPIIEKCFLSSNISQYFVSMLLKGTSLRVDVLSYQYPIEFRDVKLSYPILIESKKAVDDMISENIILYSYPTQTETLYGRNTYVPPVREVEVYKPSELVEKNPPMKDIT